jgi:hypothetical protein
MNEHQLLEEILARAAGHDVFAHAIPDSRRVLGMPGFPDVYLVGLYGIQHWELKSEGGQLSREQRLWKYRLQANSAIHRVRRPADLDSGQIDFELAELVTGRHV